MNKLLPYPSLKANGIPYSRVHLSRMVKAGQFPTPIQIGEGRVAWLEAEVNEWIATKVAKRSEAKAA